MLSRFFDLAIIRKKLLFKKNALLVVTDSAGAETNIDMTELAALNNIAAADLAKIDGITNGTAASGKALVLGASGEIATITSATITTITTNAIAGGDSSLGIAGQATAQGGDVALVGGTSSTSGNAGGAVTGTGGTPGATGVGGAVTFAAGAGGATSGNGGVASITGGAGTNGNATGGIGKIVGGAGQGTAAGGAAQVTGGAGGATGAGGAVIVTSGAGGATSGVSGDLTVATGTTTTGSGSATGAVIVQSGAGAASAAAVAGGASGAVTVRTQAGGANTGGATGQVGGAAGAVAITGGAGGATNSTGAHAGGAGAEVTLTAGAGGNATAGTGNGGKGGDIYLIPGDGGTSTGGTAGVPGSVFIKGTAGSAAFGLNVVRNTISNAGTVTVAQHRAHVLYQDASGGNVTMTAALGTGLDTAFPDAQTGTCIMQFVASNHATNTSTIAGNTGTTLVGSGAVTQTGGQFLLIKTGVGTWDLVRVG